jgi:EAL domain-containing protein (putative c-di-GMP-specific phosphodiesterase class I)/GGDEF domain-containing protein
MSLLTRLWISVIVAMLLALTGSFVVSVKTARDYLAQQLYAQSSDSATSLALSMSQQSKDAAMSELLVSALFDSGHFEAIVYRDPLGHVLVERRNAPAAPDAPAWFVELMPLRSRAGEALVSDGWKQAGKIEVLASTRFAYGALWQGTLKLAATLLVIGLLLGGAVTLLMRWVRRPLAIIVEQAQAIGERRFITIVEPPVKELRIVVRAMNAMVGRVQAMFAEQAARMDQLRDDANRDPLTRLPNRSLFMGRLRDVLDDELAPPAGSLLVMRVNDLIGLNRRLGRARADALILACVNTLQKILDDHPEALLGRLNGAEFGLLLPNVDGTGAQSIGEAVLVALDKLYRREYTDQRPIAALGWTLYQRGQTSTDVLLRVDAAVMKAESATVPLANSDDATSVSPVVHTDTWRSQIELAVDDRSFELATYPVLRSDGAVLHQEAMLRLVTQDGQRLTAGQFMPAASRLGMTAVLDLLALELAIAHLELQGDDIAVNLSPLSLEQQEFLPALKLLLDRAGDKTRRLWLELSERGLDEAHGLEAVSRLSEMLSAYGARLGIEHFGRHFSAMPRLHTVRIDYLKLDGAFIADIDSHEGNQRFVKAVVDVAGSLDIRVIAERVVTDAEWHTLSELGVNAATGPAVTARAKQQS